MPAINSDTASAWQAIANSLGAQRPSQGKRVRVVRGKHKGRDGIVLVHKLSRFGSAYRYCSEAQAHMRDMAGREGWCCQIQAEGATFWTAAEHVEVVS